MIMKATEAIEITIAVMASGSYNSGYPVNIISMFTQKPFPFCIKAEKFIAELKDPIIKNRNT
jgi:hypothetical protein